MNFFAMPTLKNDRACFFSPISINPLRGLNETFDRARIGMAKVGSFARSAAVMTIGHSDEFLSTAPFLFSACRHRGLFLADAAVFGFERSTPFLLDVASALLVEQGHLIALAARPSRVTLVLVSSSLPADFRAWARMAPRSSPPRDLTRRPGPAVSSAAST